MSPRATASLARAELGERRETALPTLLVPFAPPRRWHDALAGKFLLCNSKSSTATKSSLDCDCERHRLFGSNRASVEKYSCSTVGSISPTIAVQENGTLTA